MLKFLTHKLRTHSLNEENVSEKVGVAASRREGHADTRKWPPRPRENKGAERYRVAGAPPAAAQPWPARGPPPAGRLLTALCCRWRSTTPAPSPTTKRTAPTPVSAHTHTHVHTDLAPADELSRGTRRPAACTCTSYREHPPPQLFTAEHRAQPIHAINAGLASNNT